MLASSLLFFGIIYLLYVVISAFFKPLRAIPGPFFARFTRLWYLREIHKGHFEQTNIDLHRKYGTELLCILVHDNQNWRFPSGKIVRIAPNEYSVDDPEAAKIIYGAGSGYKKGDWYYGFAHPDPAKFTIFTDRNSKRHAAERRKYSAAYSMSSLVTYESFVDDCVRILDQRFREFSAAGMTIDLGKWSQLMAFDLIGEVTVSEKFLDISWTAIWDTHCPPLPMVILSMCIIYWGFEKWFMLHAHF